MINPPIENLLCRAGGMEPRPNRNFVAASVLKPPHFTLTHSSRATVDPGLRHWPGISEVR